MAATEKVVLGCSPRGVGAGARPVTTRMLIVREIHKRLKGTAGASQPAAFAYLPDLQCYHHNLPSPIAKQPLASHNPVTKLCVTAINGYSYDIYGGSSGFFDSAASMLALKR